MQQRERHRLRLATIGQLGRALLEANDDVDDIFHALAATLTTTLCDGCSIDLAPIDRPAQTLHRFDGGALGLPAATSLAPGVHAFATCEEARAILPLAFEPYIQRHGLRGVAVLSLRSRARRLGSVVVTRDRQASAFDDEDVSTIQTCMDYASMAAQSALLLASERSLSRTEHEQTERFATEMLGVVAHDLQSPVMAIIMGAERLGQRRPTDTGTHRIADQIVSFARRTSRMIDQMLDMTRLRLGHGLVLARCKVNLTSLVSSILEELGPANPTHQFELTGDTEVVGRWDPDRLGQVIAGLLRNATQYGRPGGAISIHIEHARSVVHLTVRNELRGLPIPPAAIAAFFEPYRRGWDDDLVGTGLGVGLYIAREIVTLHGGELSLDSTPLGTTFRVVLPLELINA